MRNLKVGDIVVRKSYGKDIYFRVTGIVNKEGMEDIIMLKGVEQRLVADAPIDDLEKPPLEEINAMELAYSKKIDRNIRKIMSERKGVSLRSTRGFRSDEVFGRPGRVLHVDADEEYLNKCLKTYKQLNINVTAKVVNEREQPELILDLLKEVKPDILVLTGHDGMLKGQSDFTDVESYRSSKYFIEAVKRARSYETSLDDLVIFAGACQSFYEAIIEAGANFASSPHRVLIHALDPVFICEKIAFTSINKVLPIQEIVSNTITGLKGVGGLETRGKYREGYPKSLYS